MKKVFFLLGAGMALSIFLGAYKVSAQDNLDSIVVEGRILRPQAAYIISRANVEFGIEAKRKNFVSKIESSIDEAPFSIK
jgi:hypothetical protein